ncbi:restriction endonuclease subunit S [Corynebacterium diphtheriae]|uniref:restriction endonuclease subunit S n=1 Tax=Corynebacterium diphtheriae TaxID=1717 RepID=UPI000246921B|nr:restriction endonuclease subunit S [Corynebacterium diphtheriae]AEX70682.1 type I restriction enzyme S subunit [Corynebacterium diphtheriae PW8]OKY23190.1 hypothetical protein AO271_09315 [Corynebacterium diphtheriae]UEB38322.1 restriction endonuclease subunit S [Corynebacterium diphtheriae]WLF42458.1 restriction endonuclease subunit S [Corynebacterium diphtheriae]CAB0617283.1 type I restriction enzyme S subunit [Corynebacterium diphtheriae]
MLVKLDGLGRLLEERRSSIVSDKLAEVAGRTASMTMLVEMVSGSGFPLAYQGNVNEELPFYKVGSLSQLDDKGFAEDRRNTISRDIARELGATIIPAGSILMAKIGAAMLLGRFVAIKVPACIDNNAMALIPNTSLITPGYLRYATTLISIENLANPGPVPSLNVTGLKMERIPLPTLDEQDRIVAELDAATAQIDAMMDKVGALKSLLTERRSALITAAVTGQIEV